MMIPCNTMAYLKLDIMVVPSFVSMSQDYLYYDPDLQSQLFNEIAHVLPDIVSFLSPAHTILQLSLLLGNIFAFLSDYVPDHDIYPIEWAFMVVTIISPVALFVQSCWPLVPLVNINIPYVPSYAESYGSKKMSLWDLCAYQMILRQYDVSFLQLKTVTYKAVERVEVEPFAQVRLYENDDRRGSVKKYFIYWIHQGNLLIYYINIFNIQHTNSR